jgi:hypothetical protein
MEIKNKKEWIKESKAEVLPLLCCTECEAKISSCSACGKYLIPNNTIGCSMLSDGKHYCEACTTKLNKKGDVSWKE